MSGNEKKVNGVVIRGDIHGDVHVAVNDGAPKPARAKKRFKSKVDPEHLGERGEIDPEAPVHASANACIASFVNGYPWIVYPSMKLTRSGLYFNEKACAVFGFKNHMAVYVLWTTDRSKIIIQAVNKVFPRRAHFHRDGCFALKLGAGDFLGQEERTMRVRYEKFFRDSSGGRDVFPHARMGYIERNGRQPLALVDRNPDWAGRVFRLRLNPDNRRQIFARVEEGYDPTDMSFVEKLHATCQLDELPALQPYRDSGKYRQG